MRRGIAWIWGCLCMLQGMPLQAEDSVGMQTAARYPIVMDKPAPGFFEGALLGNGGMGVVVTTRPDAVCLHFGHNNVWDIRVTENHQDKIGTFAEVFRKASLLPDSLPSIHHDKEFSDYLSVTADNYRSPYPRPFPCGTLLLGFDRREVELLGYSLDISDGVCHISLSVGGERHELLVYTDMEKDEAWLVLTDGQGRPAASCFNRLRVIPDPSTPGDIPRYRVWESGENRLGFYQELPYSTVQSRPEKDKAFFAGLCRPKVGEGTAYDDFGHQRKSGGYGALCAFLPGAVLRQGGLARGDGYRCTRPDGAGFGAFGGRGPEK